MTDLLESPVAFLEWDSNFFQKRIGLIKSHLMSDKFADDVDIFADKNQIDCLYYLAVGNDINSSRAAETHGYKLMDLRVTLLISLTKENNKPEQPKSIRLATQAELPVIKKMAGDYHAISRFFADEHFEKEKCRQLYEIWIERDFIDPNRTLWVVEVDGQIAGYTSASINLNEKYADIGLVGVNPKWRGQGVGLKMQLQVLAELRNCGVEKVEVVTQGRNIGAQNLYQKSGYHLKSIDLWYHKWYINQ